MLETSIYYNFIDAFVYFVAAAIPLYFIMRLDKDGDDKNKRLRRLTIMLFGFVLLQGIYHILSIFGSKIITKGIIEPLSFVAMFFFGLLYLMELLREKKLINPEFD